MTEWFDSHCHVDEEAFDEDREEVLSRMKANGVTRCAVIGSDMETSRRAAAFAAAQSGVVAAGGFHPHEASRFRESNLDELREMYQKGRIRAIGEIGLDFFYDHSPRDVQREVCIRQMELAWELKAPVAYHIRDAHQEMLEIMKGMKARLTGGIIHCFSGSAEIAKEYLKLGYYISFAGPLTFKKAPRLQEAVKLVPKDRLLIETDSPYMAPEPVRGRRNEPANVRYVGLKMAELRGEKPEEVAAFTTENAMQVYGINS
ncbi:MAG: TatD family hydrolase [Clostridia bacterium]|nr:TatD family hydrolase [Clostridia bacterium]